MFLLECQFMKGEGSKLLREGKKVRREDGQRGERRASFS